MVCSRYPVSGLVVLGTLFVSVLGCGKGNKFQPPPPPLVTVAKPIVKDVPDYQIYTGNTRGKETVQIKSRVTGYLKEIHFDPGQIVKAGDTLFTIDQRPYQAALDGALAELQAAQANEVKTRSEYERNEGLYKKNAASKADRDISFGNWDVAKADVAKAKADVQNAQINLDFATVKSTFAGKVDRNQIDKGNIVTKDITLLATVITYDPMYAYFNISEANLLKFMAEEGKEVKEKKQVRIPKGKYPLELARENDTGFPFKGWVDYIDNTVDPGTGTIQVRGIFPNPDLPYKLVPGLFVRIRYRIKLIENALMIPDGAVGANQGGQYVLVVVDKDGAKVVESRSIELGPLEGNMRAVTKGLKPDDQVIVKGLLRVREGVKVTVEPAKPADADEKKE